MTERITTTEALVDIETTKKGFREALTEIGRIDSFSAKLYLDFLEKIERGDGALVKNYFKKRRDFFAKNKLPAGFDVMVEKVNRAVDAYESEVVKKKGPFPVKNDMAGKDGTPEKKVVPPTKKIVASVVPQKVQKKVEQNTTEIQEDRQVQKPEEIIVSTQEINIIPRLKPLKHGEAYSTLVDSRINETELSTEKMQYDDKKSYEPRWGDEESEDIYHNFGTELDKEKNEFNQEAFRESYIVKRGNKKDILFEPQMEKLLLEESGGPIRKEKAVIKNSEETTQTTTYPKKEEQTASETKEVLRDINREEILKELKHLGMTKEEVEMYDGIATDKTLLEILETFRKKIPEQKNGEEIQPKQQLLISMGNDEKNTKPLIIKQELPSMTQLLGKKIENAETISYEEVEKDSSSTKPMLMLDAHEQEELVHDLVREESAAGEKKLSTEEYLERLLTPEKIEEIRKILLEGNFILTTHGAKYTTKEGEETIIPKADLDGKVSAYLLHMAGINYTQTDFVAPGKRGEGKVHVDTGEGKDLITIEDGKLYIGNHYSDKRAPTSTAEIVDILLKKTGLWKKEATDPEWKEDLSKASWKEALVQFTNDVDNMRVTGRGREYLMNEFALSLQGAESELTVKSFNTFIELFKDGYESGDVLPESIQNMVIGNDKQGKDITLKQKIQQQISGSYKGMRNAEEEMYENRIPLYNQFLGRVLVNRKETSFIGRREVTKASGYNTSITIHEGKGAFISAPGRSLEKVYEKFKKFYPEAKLIRGTMIINFPEGETTFDEQKLYQVLGLQYKKASLKGAKTFPEQLTRMDEIISKTEREIESLDTEIKQATTDMNENRAQHFTWRKQILESDLIGYQYQKNDVEILEIDDNIAKLDKELEDIRAERKAIADELERRAKEKEEKEKTEATSVPAFTVGEEGENISTENKKADIEKRRQEELERENLWFPIVKPILTEYATEKTNEINAKYDKELTELIGKEQEISQEKGKPTAIDKIGYLTGNKIPHTLKEEGGKTIIETLDTRFYYDKDGNYIREEKIEDAEGILEEKKADIEKRRQEEKTPLLQERRTAQRNRELEIDTLLEQINVKYDKELAELTGTGQEVSQEKQKTMLEDKIESLEKNGVPFTKTEENGEVIIESKGIRTFYKDGRFNGQSTNVEAMSSLLDSEKKQKDLEDIVKLIKMEFEDAKNPISFATAVFDQYPEFVEKAREIVKNLQEELEDLKKKRLFDIKNTKPIRDRYDNELEALIEATTQEQKL